MERAAYVEKVYAGVLGKIIGVYLGRPIEGWEHERIVRRLGTVSSYVNEELGVPLVVTDDDISGTFTFIRALEDYGDSAALAAQAIGQTWLNYLVEGKTILWWGGRGTSTEHTAYLNLKAGVPAPASGSAETNGRTVANQIGAMIFIDGWAMVSPGDPEQAVRLARAAASVSHDDEAVNAAVVIAAMEALAFVESDLQRLLDEALRFIPESSTIARQVKAVRELHAREGAWREARAWLDRNHGYHHYKGTCHVVPNFSLIILALLYGAGDFRESMTIVNTSGWDTDCNAGNLGCLLGIRNGLAALERCPDLRRPPRDLMYISSADGGRGITDAAREAHALANMHFRMRGEPPIQEKGGARYSFAFPGALHGFHAVLEDCASRSVQLENRASHAGNRELRILFDAALAPALVAVPVFIPPGAGKIGSYDLQASPCLYPGQTIRAKVSTPPENGATVSVRLFVTAFGEGDTPRRHHGPVAELSPGSSLELAWPVDAGTDSPIFEAGLELTSASNLTQALCLDWMDWGGVPDLVLQRPHPGALAWKSAWVDAVDHWATQFTEPFHLSQDRGVGLVIQGMREWGDYAVAARVAMYGLKRGGVVARVQGLRRHYALELDRERRVRLVKERDGTTVLAERGYPVEETRVYGLRLSVQGTRVRAWIDEEPIFDVQDPHLPLESGALGLILEEGTLLCDAVRVEAIRDA